MTAPGGSGGLDRSQGLDLDLDVRSPVRTLARRPSPYRLAVTAALVVGTVLGAAVGVARTSAPVPVARALVTMRLQGAVLTDAATAPRPAGGSAAGPVSGRASAVLALSVQNLGNAPLLAERLAVAAGAGLRAGEFPVGWTVSPGDRRSLTLRVPLACPGGTEAIRATLLVRPSPEDGDPQGGASPAGAPPGGPIEQGGPVAADVMILGRLAIPGGLCYGLDTLLPLGWQEPARATAWRVDTDGTAHLSVGGLAPDVTDVVSAEIDDVLIPVHQGPVLVREGRADLTLGVPQTGCQTTASRPVIGTGIQLLVAGPEGSRYSHVPIDETVADWLMAAFAASCPDSPAGPSAIRPGLGE